MSVKFDFERVVSGWWTVTVGRATDEIEYSVIADGEHHNGRYCRLDELVALYECSVAQCPTAEHPRSTAYEIRERDDSVQIEVAGKWFTTNYRELRQTLRKFLSRVFTALDKGSVGKERQEAFEFMRGIETIRPFDDIYEEISQK